MNDDAFLHHVAEHLATLPGVQAVSLGGSRAEGTHRPDSDWDFAIYYREHFEPQALRDLGWPGQVFEIGAWGGGVFNSGAWLVVDERRTDVHYRDLAVVEEEVAAAAEGRFRIEPLMFHLAGIPSYLVLAELAVSKVLLGQVPTVHYPAALREQAPKVWWDNARLTFDYARFNHARHGRLAQCAGLVVQAASQAAHAVLAARGEWITNDKTLLTRANLREIDHFVADAHADPQAARRLVDVSEEICATAVQAALIQLP